MKITTVLMVVSWLAAGGRALAGFAVVTDGVPQCEIIIPAQPSKAERFIAEELQAQIKNMSGAELAISARDDLGARPGFVIGNHRENQAVRQELDRRCGDSYDRFAVVCKGARIHLVAAHSTPLLYSGWEWLERQGVAWLMPGANGAEVPPTKTLQAADMELYSRPRSDFRSCTNYFHPGNGEWALKQGFPSSLVNAREHGYPAVWLWAWRMRITAEVPEHSFDPADTYAIIGGGHSYDAYLPASRYAKDHPEWYNLVGGRRLNGADALRQVCYTNRAAAKEFAANLCGTIKAYAAQGIPVERMRIYVSPNDWETTCECPNCKKLHDADGMISSLVLNFANLVAAEVRQSYPRATICYYVYHNYGRIPQHVKPGPGVQPDITAWTANNSLAVNNAQPLFSSGNPIYSSVFKWFAAQSDSIAAYTYYGHFELFAPWPMLTQMFADLKQMSSNKNFIGMNSESHLQWSTQGITFYLYPRLLWNPELSQGPEVAAYCRQAYGPAAPFAEAYFNALQRQMDAQPYFCGFGAEIKNILTPAIMDQCNVLMAEAARTLPHLNAAMRWRVQLLLDGWKYSEMYGRAMQLLADGKTPACQAEIKQLLDDIRAFAMTDAGRMAFEYRCVDLAIARYDNAVRVNLSAIPAGESIWEDSLMHGGTLKFYAVFQNYAPALWGYAFVSRPEAQAPELARLELPLRTAAGTVFKQVDVRLNVTSPGKLYAASPGVPFMLVSETPQQTVTLPAKLMGGHQLTLRLEQPFAKNGLALAGGWLKVQVVPR
jgi:hypothetical protein